MTLSLHFFLLVAALICFLLATVGYGKINLTALGLALVTLAELVTH